MIELTIEDLAQACGADTPAAGGAMRLAGVSTDSRTVQPGEAFFALTGERFDGHAYVAAALARGAAVAVVRRERAAELAAAEPRLSERLVVVGDVLKALGEVGRHYRQRLTCPVIAVVGSNGKTTTKGMLHHVLSGRWRGLASPRSFNNAIGVPLTLLSAKATDEYVVVEIGTNAPGEVAALAELAQPTHTVLTSIGEEHLEGLGDIDGVAREETAVLRAMTGGYAAVNVDHPAVRPYLIGVAPAVTTFGTADGAALRLTDVAYAAPWLAFGVNGAGAFRLRMPGLHNATNALGAIAAATSLGCEQDEIAARLATFEPPAMRGEVVDLGGVTVINDAYNANPASAAAAIDMLAGQPCRGRRIVVFGEMRELGPRTRELHEGVARRLRDAGADEVWLVGAAGDMMAATLDGRSSDGPRVVCMSDAVACGPALAEMVRPGDVVLLKASRAVGLERVLEPLAARGAAATR